MREFSLVQDMVKLVEMLFGPYACERLDLLVLPSSFPHGGL
jgi:hypothetical protein